MRPFKHDADFEEDRGEGGLLLLLLFIIIDRVNIFGRNYHVHATTQVQQQ